MTRLVLFGPGASCFQNITVLLALDPRLKSFLVDRQIENTRATKQFTERLHHFRYRGKNNLVHCFGLSPTSVGIEVDPASVRTKHEHTRFWHRVARADARLGHKVRSLFTAGAEIQNLRVPIVISDRSHGLQRQCAMTTSGDSVEAGVAGSCLACFFPPV